jgi:hypothetical protein
VTPESFREAAVETFLRVHARPSRGWERTSEASPFDLFLLQPSPGGVRATFVVVKNVDDPSDGDLSDTETRFGLFAERHSAAYVVARYRLIDGEPSSERLFRPFLEPPPPECEIVFEVTRA